MTAAPARDHVTDAHLNHVTTAQLANDSKVEKGAVTTSSVLIEPEADSPDLLLLERALGTNQSAFVPGSKFMKGWAHWRVTHRSSASRPLDSVTHTPAR